MKRRHTWITSTVKGKVYRYCTMCGADRTPATERTACRPTRL